VMNMVGHPKHVTKALDLGVDVICAQGGEGGGHTGDIPFSILIPACIDVAKGRKSPLTGEQVMVVAAGGISDGRGLAAALSYGAVGVWVGTRLVASIESGAPSVHKDFVVSAGFDDVTRTTIYTGRPMNVRRTPYVRGWESRAQEIDAYLSEGKIPIDVDLSQHPEKSAGARPWLMGKVAASINDVKTAQEIVDELVNTAAKQLSTASSFVISRTKL